MTSRNSRGQRPGKVKNRYPDDPILLDFQIEGPSVVLDFDGFLPEINVVIWEPSATAETGTVTYAWASSDDGVFTCDPDTGEITRVADGSASLQATATTGSGQVLTKSILLAVDVETTPVSIPVSLDFGVSGNLGVNVQLPGTTSIVTVQVFDAFGVRLPQYETQVTWAVLDTGKATCTAGPNAVSTVSPVAVGDTELTATLTGSFTTVTKTVALHTLAAPTFAIRYANKCNTPPPYAHADLALHFPDPIIGLANGVYGASTMFGDQSGASNVIVKTRPYNGSGVPPGVTGQVASWPLRSPYTAIDAGAPDGYCVIMNWDISGTNGTTAGVDIDRAVEVKFTNGSPPGYDRHHVRQYYKMAPGTLGGPTGVGTSVGKKFIRFRINSPLFGPPYGKTALTEAAGMVGYYNVGSASSPIYKWVWLCDDLGSFAITFANTGNPLLDRVQADNAWHLIEVGYYLDRVNWTLEVKLWHDGVLVLHYGPSPTRSYNVSNSSQFVEMRPSHGPNVIYFDSVFNTPAQAGTHRYHSRVIANDYIGPRVGAGW